MMINEIKYQNQSIPYRVRTSRRARYLRVSIGCDTGVMLTVPWGMEQSRWQSFLRAKAGWIAKKLNCLKRFAALPRITAKRGEYKKSKQQAYHLALQKVEHWNQFYNFSLAKISIKNPKTRWGSCSKKGNLNFNYKIIHLPSALLDYLIVHELCHLQEFNHSKKFWELVAQAIPDYKHQRKILRQTRVLQ